MSPRSAILVCIFHVVLGCDEKAKPSTPEPPKPTTTVAPLVSAASSGVATSTTNALSPSTAEPAREALARDAGAVAAALATTAAGAKPTDAKHVGLHIKGNNFAVDVSAPGNCKVNVPCVMSIKLTAMGAFHLNNEYPYKWVGDPIDGIEYVGSKTGEFKKESETQGTMFVRFKSAGANPKIAGVYKMSVCSEDKCQLETQRVELNIPTS